MLNRATAIETANSFLELKMLGYNPNQAWLFDSDISVKTHACYDIDLALWDNNFSGVMYFDAKK